MISKGRQSVQHGASFVSGIVGGAGVEAAGEKVGRDNELYFQYEFSGGCVSCSAYK